MPFAVAFCSSGISRLEVKMLVLMIALILILI